MRTPRFLAMLIGSVILYSWSSQDAAAQDAPNFPCANPPRIEATIPGDTVLSDQQSFNCFAWQEFIGVNWPSKAGAGPSDFGTPRDQSPVVFETYHNIHDFLLPDGTLPNPEDSVDFLPEGTDETVRILSRASKLGNNFDPSKDINEAAPQVAWLADRDANLVWYEILVNDHEYDYFIENRLYNSEAQYEHVTRKKQKINLPRGVVGGDTGAMEFKAAWLTVPSPDDPKWQKYKLSKGIFCTTGANEEPDCTENTIALIGLHILHKTASQPSWTWATFEHVDNVPDQAMVDAGALDREYTFYNESCTPLDVPAACSDGKIDAPHEDLLAEIKQYVGESKTSCIANTPPAYALGDFTGGEVDPDSPCQPYPIRATRVFPLPETHENPIVQTNLAAQELIRQANPDSVYQYYQLINVMWADSPVDENAGVSAPIAPLSKTAFRPELSTFPVSNPVLETYVQNLACLDCHSNATIASSILEGSPVHASDYSFIFGMAGPKRPESQD